MKFIIHEVPVENNGAHITRQAGEVITSIGTPELLVIRYGNLTVVTTKDKKITALLTLHSMRFKEV